MSGYRDLDGESPHESAVVADEVGAPDPKHAETPAAQHAEPSTGPSTTRSPSGATMALAVVVVLLAGLVAYRVTHTGAPAAVAPAMTTPGSGPTPLPATPPARTPSSAQVSPSSPSAAPSRTSAAQPPGTAPEPSAVLDGGSAAMATARAFLPAWTLNAAPSARRDALAPVASAHLVDQLANTDPTKLPTITGPAKQRSGNPSAVVVTVQTSTGTAVLTVQPVNAQWRVTEVTLEAATS